MCQYQVPKAERFSHFEEHTEQIDSGPAAGDYTFSCSDCGPPGLKWDSKVAAGAGVWQHAVQRHGFPRSW